MLNSCDFVTVYVNGCPKIFISKNLQRKIYNNHDGQRESN